MIQRLVERLQNKNIFTEKIAIARFILALGTLLTLLFNDINIVTNHDYKDHITFSAKHDARFVPLKKADLFMNMPAPAAKTVIIVILLVVMSGFAPQVTCLLHVLACFSVRNYIMVPNGGDEIGLMLAVLLLPLCLADPRINQWKKVKTPQQYPLRNIVGNIAFFAIQLQASVIYLYAAISKMSFKHWQDGTAIYSYSSHPFHGAPDWLRHINEFITLSPVVIVITWATLALELFIGLCIFAPRRIKKIFLVLGLVFHFLIIINFGLISFFCTMAALLILYLDSNNVSVKYFIKYQRKINICLRGLLFVRQTDSTPDS